MSRLLLCLSACCATGAIARGQVVISTVPVEQVWVADGVTEYQMDVWLDSTPLPDEYIGGAQWSLFVPAWATFVRSDFPASQDFFEGYDMFPGFNRIDDTVQDGELKDNVRITDVMQHGANYGPQDRIGKLGSYWFTVNPGATPGETAFDLNEFYTAVANGVGDPLPFTEVHLPLTIVSTCPADLDGSGAVDLGDLSLLLTHFGTPAGAGPLDGDLDLDGDVDLVDLSQMLGQFGVPCP